MDNAAKNVFLQQVLPMFEATRADWIKEARTAARRIAAEFGRVTIDDVRALCPPPASVDGRVMGAVFPRQGFERIGYERSTRTISHHRAIAVFRLKGAA